MTSYLEGGWYHRTSRARLRTEVVDGAMDVAGMLLRAGVPARRLLRTALKVRTLIVIADPLMRGTSRFGRRDRELIAQQLAYYTDGFPPLQGFINDCLEHVTSASDMTAFYLHLVHVTRMMQLLAHAVSSDPPSPHHRASSRGSGTKPRGLARRQKAGKKPAANAKRSPKTRRQPAKKGRAKAKVSRKKAAGSGRTKKVTRPKKKSRKGKHR